MGLHAHYLRSVLKKSFEEYSAHCQQFVAKNLLFSKRLCFLVDARRSLYKQTGRLKGLSRMYTAVIQMFCKALQSGTKTYDNYCTYS